MTHVHQDIGAYVLNGLDADTGRRVREHVATCPDCSAAHAELAGIPALLDLAVIAGAADEEPLASVVEERVLDRFARERAAPPRRRGRWPRLALGVGSALAGAAVAAALLVFGLGFERDGGRSAPQYQLAFRPVGKAPGSARARAALRTSAAGTVLRLWVSDLPGGPGDVYEVLCDAKGWSASAGTFRVDRRGDAYVILTTAVKHGQYDRIRVVRRAQLRSGKIESYDILGAKLA